MIDFTRFSNPFVFAANAAEADETAADELLLYLDNDRRFSPQSPEGQGRSIAINLLRKMKSGKYDHSKAPKLWLYLIDNAAKAYAKDFGGEPRDWNRIFSPATRRYAAQEIANEFRSAVERGEYAHLRV